MPKDSFIIHHDQRKLFERLGPAKLGELILAMMDYSEFGTERNFEDVELGIAFAAVQPFMDKNTKRYEVICERNKKNGALGGRPKANPDEPKKPSGFSNNPNNPVGPDTDTDLVSCLSLKSLPQSQENAFPQVGGETPGSPVGSLRAKKAGSKFVPPSLEEVSEYLQSKGSSIDAEAFHAFYESKGWMVGKSKMKNWKAAVRTWEAKRKGESKPEDTSWHKYREWEKRYLERRGAIYSANQEPTTESVDAAAKVIRSLIGPEEYTEPMVADAIAWLLEVPERCRNVPTLATLMDDLQGWGRVITWASNGARGGNVPDDPWGKMF